MSASSLPYDNMYRVTGKSQHLSQTGVQFDGTLSAGYDLKYTYSGEEGKHFQLAGVDDVNYSAETVTEDTKVVNAHAYEYDANGNLIFVNTSRTKKDGQTTPNSGERKLKWDEENRLTASDDNGFVTSYWYDASGERTVKSSGENAAMFVNAEFAGGTTNTSKFSLYVSPYLVANQGGRYTKHIYIGSQRIVSKLGDLKSYGADPRRIEYAGSESDGPKVDYKTKYALQQQVIKDNFAHFDVPYNGADNNDYVDGKGFSERDGSLKSAMLKAASLKDNFQQGDSYEQYQYFYFYHPDHLGSSSFITNTEGEVVQHIEYVPYGEVFIEERNNVWNTPYLFNAKEFDEETGLYYYGARYYDSRLSMWYGVDALAEKYPNMGGYVYCAGNPVKFIDPDGEYVLSLGGKAEASIGIPALGVGVSATAGVAFDSHGVSAYSSYTFTGACPFLCPPESKYFGVIIGAGGSVDVVASYDWKAEYFIQYVSKTNISISGGPGYHVGAGIIASGEDSFDGISIQGGLGRGIELGFSSGGNTNVISSISVSYEEANTLGVSIWSVDNQELRVNDKGQAYFSGKVNGVIDVKCNAIENNGKYEPSCIWSSDNYWKE